MATRVLHRLNAAKVRNINSVGSHEDGGGLRLVVAVTGAKRWVMRVTINDKRRELGLGGYPFVSLEAARKRAAEIREAAKEGRDLIRERRSEQQRTQAFRLCFEEVYDLRRERLSNRKALLQWRSTMETYVLPSIGDLPVAEIQAGHVLAVLRPIWFAKPETGKRVLQRMETVFRSAILRGLRDKASPCIGVQQELGTKHREVVSHRSLPYAAVPAFLVELRKGRGRLSTRLALEWLILTATRSGETRFARWEEIDQTRKIWTIPASRMKARRPHMVPLTTRCLEILEEAGRLRKEESLIFPGTISGRPLSDMTFTKLMRDAGVDAVPHGFRSSFRSWAAEVDKTRHEVAEAALAHTIRGKSEAAYNRANYLEDRRALMTAWATFLQ
jgi:integrase